MQKKIKVVWICHFSNKDVRAKIKTSYGKFELFVRKLFGKNNESFKNNDFAPWVNNLIHEFEQFENVELHIIAPVSDLIVRLSEFEIRDVKYHFFRGNLKFPFEHIVRKLLGSKRSFINNKQSVKSLIKKINPDIVNLIGSENPYYSATILGIKDIPIYVSAQTVYTNPDRLKLSGERDQLRWNIEMKIHKKEKYFGCSGRLHYDLILQNNPEAIIFKMFFPIQHPSEVKIEDKIYDFVSFSQSLSPKKGTNDAVKALAIVKKKFPDVSLNLIGNFDKSSAYGKDLLQQIGVLGLTENIIFTPYFPIHSDMHQYTQKSRFALLPVKLDVISGSIIEAILLDLPIVTYKTTGTPYLNKDTECVLISDVGNIEALAANMIKLMESPELANVMRIKAKEFVNKTYDNTRSAKRLLADYYAVIEHYHHGTPISDELLFKTNEFPKYD